MAQEIPSDFPLSSNELSEAIKDIELSINRMERMLDWLLLMRESVANLNLDLYTTFKPIETLQESNLTVQNEAKTGCPLHPDCDRITNLVASNLNKISDQQEEKS